VLNKDLMESVCPANSGVVDWNMKGRIEQ